MKELKSKIFYIVFVLLSIFIIFVFSIYNIRNYVNEYIKIKDSLFKAENMNRNKSDDSIFNKHLNDKPNDFKNIKFMDSKIYTIMLDENNNITDIIYHFEDESDKSIKELSEKIINETESDKTKIGILYFNNYAYSYSQKNYLIVMDISEIKSSLLNSAYLSLLLIIILELIVYFISRRITTWVITPVLESFNKQKQFVSDASHELKTPLAVIMASSEILSEEIENKYLDNIKSESERMNNLIKKLLDLSKLENKEKENYKEINLSKILEKSSLTYESIMFEKNVSLKTDIEDDIIFKCDGDSIKQLNAILLDNAIKHSENNSEITVSLSKSKNEVIFKVTNKGKEIKVEDREKIFERFYRVDKSRNRNENRYGLGLAIAKQIVTNHNGKIFVTCDDGYTTFNVILKIN